MNAYQNAIETRIAYEQDKCASNDTIVKTLRDLQKNVSHDAIASVLAASNVDAEFINRQERVNARFNVYSAEKVVNIARNVAKVATLNHYTRAIVATALALEAQDKRLTHRDAVCACSANVKHTDSKRESVLKSMRYAKHISANTARTQASSSLNALQVFDIVRESRDESNAATFTLNRENDATRALIASLQA